MKFPPCHRLLRHPVKTLTGSLLLVLACRLVWIAARSETSSTILADHVFQATRGAVDLRRTSVFEHSAVEQADFWLSEVDRIVEADPDRADLAIGAAWCLCTFRQGFPFRIEASRTDLLPYVDRSSHSSVSDRASEIFAARCWRKRVDLAERATRLQPDDVRWWRARSLLDTTRSSNWREALTEASRHDPENALYDYLAAAHLWNQSYRKVHDEGGDRYEMADAQLIEEGRARFDAAVPAMDLDSFTNLGVQYGVAKHSWGEAAIQWLGYRGPFVTGLLGFGLVGACCAARAARVARRGGAPANPLSSQAFWAGCCAAISRCAWAPGVACLVAYLVIAPGYFETSDLQYARVIGHLRDPRQEWQAIRTALSQQPVAARPSR